MRVDLAGSWRWGAEIDLNLSGVFYGRKYQVPAILASGGGAIVNNASNLGVAGMGSVSAYVAAKHGVVGLTKAVDRRRLHHAVRQPSRPKGHSFN
ncbi:SDR family NAD(P)-dependent oxidoreductase [Saccharopolyspora spinosa]|uniref:SDR family NAD(P)-dependent oxidoreductase n=1 Tax=Saccharopolyspora spinosa TaxID=60894 RepID=UPI000237896E|nr:SDR family NAD(P)-dependent oxidoreductase [Saccharopolyspora spinosa]